MSRYRHDLIFYKTGLPALREQAIGRIALGEEPTAADRYDAGEALVAWVGLLLEKIARLSADQRELVLRTMRSALLNAGRTNSQFLLVFLDDNRATWTGYQGYLDLQTGQNTLAFVPHLVSVAYNISELNRRAIARYDVLATNIGGAADGNSSPETDSEGSVGGPGLVCDDAPDPGR